MTDSIALYRERLLAELARLDEIENPPILAAAAAASNPDQHGRSDRMTTVITREIEQAYEAYLNEPVDCFFDGAPIKRRNTHPYSSSMSSGLVDFAAGWQRGLAGENADGTPAGRFRGLLDELQKRLPDPTPFASSPPELRYLASLDRMIAATELARDARRQV
jgi:hypothetical protein